MILLLGMKRKRSPGVARSFEEVRWVAYLLDTLGLNVSPQSVVAALHDGTRHNLFDMYTALGEDLHLYGDYDGGYYHNEHRVNRDRTKTLRIIEDDERAVVLRTRVRAAHLSVEVFKDRRRHTRHGTCTSRLPARTLRIAPEKCAAL